MGSSFEEYRKEYLENTPWRGSVNAKLDAAEPYNFFLTRIKDSHPTYGEDLSITFPGTIQFYFPKQHWLRGIHPDFTPNFHSPKFSSKILN